MNQDDALAIIEEGLGAYPLSPIIAEAIKATLMNRYESLVIVNARGEIAFMDGATEKFFKLSPGEAKRKKVEEFVPYSELPDVIAKGVPRIGITKTKDRNIVISRFPLMKDGKVIGAYGRAILHSFEELERLRKEADKLRAGLQDAEKKMKQEYQATYTLEHILGASSRIMEQKELAKRMARSSSDILIEGESGTGKEMFAHAIHSESRQKTAPFIRVNCPAIPLEIAESELFGYEKGAFTGASREGKPGKFELAQGGTIFLDEIGALPLSIQAKLLRVVQEREIERLGSKKTLKLTFRLITATNVNLKKLAEEGKFRFDLFFRLSKAILTLPPLRSRPEDIPVYVTHFLSLLNKNREIQIKSISQEALDLLCRYQWPGNVREITNVLEQSFYNMRGAEVLYPEHLPHELTLNPAFSQPYRGPGRQLRETMEQVERENIAKALSLHGGNKRKTAQYLGIQRSVLYLRLKKLGLS